MFGHSSKISNHTKSAVVLALVTIGFGSSAYAGLAACSGTYNLGSGTSGLAAGGTNAAGCEQVDKNFNAFSYSSSGTPTSGAVAGGNVPVTFAGTSDPGPISVLFGSNSTWDVSVNGTTTSGAVAYNIGVDPTPPAQFAPPTGENYAIVALALGEQATITSGFPAGTANDSIVLFEYFCAGGQNACLGGSAATGGINLNAATAGFFKYTQSGTSASSSTSTSSCFNNGNTNVATDCGSAGAGTAGSALVSFASGNYSLGFQNVYTYSTFVVSSGGDDTSLNFFKETYFEELNTPEPATFGMMGAALIGLAFFGLRKRA